MTFNHSIFKSLSDFDILFRQMVRKKFNTSTGAGWFVKLVYFYKILIAQIFVSFVSNDKHPIVF